MQKSNFYTSHSFFFFFGWGSSCNFQLFEVKLFIAAAHLSTWKFSTHMNSFGISVQDVHCENYFGGIIGCDLIPPNWKVIVFFSIVSSYRYM